MNRSLAYVGVAVVLSGVSFVASPIALTGRMTFDLIPMIGVILAPLGLFVVGLAAASFDPRRTTVAGTFGSDAVPEPPPVMLAAAAATGKPANPKAPVRCPNCRTVMTYDLARCPRCAEDRPCRSCGRPLVSLEEHAACPGCSRPELFCNCAQSVPAVRKIGVGRSAIAR